MTEPTLPKRSALEDPLLKILEEMGGRIRFSEQGREIEVKLASAVGLSDEARDFSAPNYNSKGKRKWRNHIQFVRDDLAKKGLLDKSERDFWSITTKGENSIPSSDKSHTATETLSATHASFLDDTAFSEEGKKKIVFSVSYERSAKNRAIAIEHHGNTCYACGFNFDRFYGSDLAKGFIEIHHVTPISRAGVNSCDPKTDLIPLCSNCHSMVHRKKDACMALSELIKHIESGPRD